ncbi:Lpp/OprI family alanine-zipper lipoprotein [Methylomagnum ishizawai]|uniref:Lpp/OprI family alanine-zipper lipoprotein n=1 Tax=Methylomagnum ishizawai TaxID=1760988 RepID=UPI001C3217F6|nr:Lpp/OprI family alanine-zipper lipoprotein [Methylomagnum ishizawai]BBL73821.1 hypothetical protein MishRS11D_09190 [Methylomagnum ishizawai]
MKSLPLPIILILSALLASCANKSDVGKIQTQIDGLKSDVSTVKATADEALSTAQAAEAYANKAARAAQYVEQDINDKLDGNYFKKGCLDRGSRKSCRW